MIRTCLSILALGGSVLFASVANAQPAVRGGCAVNDPACSTMIPAFAAMGSMALAPKSGQAGLRHAMTVSPLTLAEPASRAQVRIHIGAEDALPKNSFLRIRGLPPAFTVPHGHMIAAGSWAVPLFALPDLEIGLPADTQGWSEVTLALVAPDGTVLAESKTKLVVASRPSPGDAAAPGKSRRVTPADRERALDLHAQGLAQLEIGNIVGARRFFELATEAGLPQSVMALAATYDPNELVKLGGLGPRPDVEAARRWYHKARDLGAADAERRMQRLGAR